MHIAPLSMRGTSSISPSGGLIRCRIGVDLMGSDRKPEELLKDLLRLKFTHSHSVQLIFFGTRELFRLCPPPPENISFHLTDEVITMDDNPLTAIRLKKNSSLCTGIDMLKKHHIDAFISSGNTGALTACSAVKLPMIPGIDRPALLSLLPTRKEEIVVLDVGANTSYKAINLLQFAKMGIAYQKTRGVKFPKVGLLNIGEEASKGTPELKEAHIQLESLNTTPGTFVGNLEARYAFEGQIDVLITDGFTGNVFLKTAEGIATVILEQLEETTKEETSVPLKQLLANLRHRLYYADYPGALLCGVEGIILKCHGNPTPKSIRCSIAHAVELITSNFLFRLKSYL